MNFDYEKVKKKFGKKYADELKERESDTQYINNSLYEKEEQEKEEKRNKAKRKKVIRWFITGILSLIWMIGLVYFMFYLPWQIDKNVYSYYELSYASGDAEQMSDFFTQLLDNMEREGMTEGHYAIIFKTPRNNIGIDYQIFERLRDRSEHLHANYDKGSFDYAETMDDIKMQMGKTGFSPTFWFIYNKRLIIYLLWCIILPLIIISVIYNLCKGSTEY